MPAPTTATRTGSPLPAPCSLLPVASGTYLTGPSTAWRQRAYSSSNWLTWSSGLLEDPAPKPTLPTAAFVPTCVVAAINFSKSSAMSSVRRAPVFPSMQPVLHFEFHSDAIDSPAGGQIRYKHLEAFAR